MEDLRLSQASEAQIRQLVDVVVGILSGQAGEHCRRLLFKIQRTLRQFHLQTQIEESDVLIEAYLRTRTRIEAGELIENIPAWLSRVAFNIIREASRKRGQGRRLKDRLVGNGYGQPHPAPRIEATYSDDEDIEALFSALDQLNPSDLNLLKLRIVQGLSWQAVSERLMEEGENCKNPRVLQQRLRKRGERSLKRLRDKFLAIKHAGRGRGGEP